MNDATEIPTFSEFVLCIEEINPHNDQQETNIDTKLFIEYIFDEWNNYTYRVVGLRQSYIKSDGSTFYFEPYSCTFSNKKDLKRFVRWVIPKSNRVNIVLYNMKFPAVIGKYACSTYDDFEVQAVQANQLIAYDDCKQYKKVFKTDFKNALKILETANI